MMKKRSFTLQLKKKSTGFTKKPPKRFDKKALYIGSALIVILLLLATFSIVYAPAGGIFGLGKKPDISKNSGNQNSNSTSSNSSPNSQTSGSTSQNGDSGTGSPSNGSSSSSSSTSSSTPSPTVRSITIDVSPTSDNHCSTLFKFAGQIMTNGATTVNYRWERSDGQVGTTQSLVFAASETKTVNINWHPTTTSDMWGWERIRIFSPNSLLSRQAVFHLYCD